MIERSGGGDFLVIRTTGTDAYNNDVFDMIAPCGLGADSVATLIVTSREGSFDPFVARTIRSAEALWIAGGNQALHHGRWRETPVADAIHDLVARGVPVGGTSSGLAVMGEYAYTSESDGQAEPHLTSTQAIRDPAHPRVMIRGNFLHLPWLDGAILEPHFIQESRYGRMAAFLNRIVTEAPLTDAWGIGIDRKTALLVEPDGSARVITGPDHPHGKVILFRLASRPVVCAARCTPLTVELEALEYRQGDRIDLSRRGGAGGTSLHLSIEAGVLKMAPQAR